MDDLVKQRLVGSSVLAFLALLLIPWMFGDPQDPRASIRASFDGSPIPIAASDDDVVLLTAKPVPTSTRAPQATPTPTPRRYLSEPTVTKSPSKASSTPSPARTASVEQAETSWTLQLISYNNKDNADAFRAKLSRDGYVAWREEVKVKGKTYYRVRMKVRGSKSQAIDLKKKLESKYRINAKLIGE